MRAIISPAKNSASGQDHDDTKQVCLDLINDAPVFDGDVCTYDRPGRLHKMFEGVSAPGRPREIGPSLADLRWINA